MKALTLLLIAQAAGPGPLVTDRPDQTESTNIIAVGFVQLEAGWTLDHERAGGLTVRTHAVPGMLARVGLTDRLEGRLGFAGFQTTDTEGLGTTTSGLGDMELGFKYRLLDGSGGVPTIALIGAVSVPTGEQGVSSERLDPGVLVVFANELSERVSLGYNLGTAWSSVDDGAGGRTALMDLIYTVSIGVGLTDRFAMFAESFGAIAVSDRSEQTHAFDGGFTYQLTDAFQVDVSTGVGLNAAASDWFVGAGIAVRLPR